MKKILMCYHSAELGGVEKQILDIIKGLSKEFEIFVACPNGPLVKEYLEAGAVKHLNLSPKFEADFKYVSKISSFCKENNIDIIHSHELKTGSLSTFAGWLAKVPKRIYHVHTPFSQWRHGSIKKYPALFINTFVNAIVGNIFATDVIALTETIKEIRIKKEFISKKKIRVIPNGVNTEEFKVLPISGEDIRKRYGIDKSTFLLGHMGRFTAEKGHEYFIKAFAKLKNDKSLQNIDLKILFAGGGVLLNDMKKLAKELDIESSIIFTDRFEDKDKVSILNAMDIFVFPSYAEGFGIVLLEAMACGLPVLSSDLPVLRDVGNDSISYFKTGDIDSLYENMKLLISNKSQLKAYAKKSIDRAGIFSMKKFWGYYRDLYSFD